MRKIVALVSGLIFGAGLTLSDMINPARVRGFLDMFGGAWDPTLAFVMGGALVVMAIAWRIVPGMARPVFADDFHIPTKSELTPQLIGGSVLFGIGWGVAGLCPGPGVAALAIEPVGAAIFVVSMLAGMVIHRMTEGKA